MKVKTNGFEVIGTGSVLTYDESPVEFIFEDKGKTMTLRFRFVDDDKEQEEITKPKLVNEYELELIFYNFKPGNPVYVIKPVPIGSVNDRKLFLRYSMETLDDKITRNIHYSWYLEEASNV